MWRFKYLLIGMLFPALFGLGLYLVAPHVSDYLKDTVSDAAAEDVQQIFDRETPDEVQAGQLIITEADLNQIISNPQNEDDTWYQNNMSVQIDDGTVRIILEDKNGDDEVLYSVVPAVENGKFILTERKGILSIFKTAQEAISDEIEDQTNQLFTDSGVVPVSVSAEDGRIVIVTQSTTTGSTGAKPTATAGSTQPKPTATP